jgi:hypothetical protein
MSNINTLMNETDLRNTQKFRSYLTEGVTIMRFIQENYHHFRKKTSSEKGGGGGVWVLLTSNQVGYEINIEI